MGFIILSCGDDDMMMQPAPGETCSGETPSYQDDIEPIISAACAISGCHVNGFGSGDFSSYTGVKDRASGIKNRAVVQQNMPPSSSPGPSSLNDAQIELLECWIDAGAPNN